MISFYPCILIRFVLGFVRSHLSVLKRNARVLRASSGQNGPAHGSEPLRSPAPVGQSAANRRWWREKCTRALDLFHLNWPEPVLFGRPERTNGKLHRRNPTAVRHRCAQRCDSENEHSAVTVMVQIVMLQR